MCLYFVYFFFSSRRRHTRCALVTGVQTCALPISSEVWFYEHPYPEGYKSYSKTKPLRIEEFRGEDSEQAWWGDIKTRADREENDRAWKVSAEEIKARGYNLDISNPHRREEDHQDPAELLAAWQENRKQLVATQEQLKAVLADALTKSTAA